MRFTSRLTGALCAAVVSAGVAAAAADATTPVPYIPPLASHWGVAAQGEFTGVAAGTGNTLAYTCAAQGLGPVVSVSITRCGIYKNFPRAFPGTTAVTAGEEFVPFGQTFQLCWTASAVLVNTSTTRETSGCTNAGVGALAGTGTSLTFS